MRNKFAVFLPLLFGVFSAQTHAQVITLQCTIEIVKTFSIPGPPRRYVDNAQVEIEETANSKRINVKSINLTSFVNTASFYKEIGFSTIDQSTGSTWHISMSKTGPQNSFNELDRTEIIIDRVSGSIAVASYSGNPSDWMRTNATGNCAKRDPSALKF